ncbi:ABC transporter ATP-binding protein [Halobacteriales archaeon Cl-PHB]
MSEAVDIETVPTYDDALFSARDIESGYGDLQILHGANVEVRDDEIVLIFGPNGAGKSTFLKALYNLLPLWAGTIEMNGEDLTGYDSHEMVNYGVSYVPQRSNVFPNLTVEENLNIGSIYADDVAARRERMFDLFPRLEDRTNQKAETLSGGERQMLAMARALLPDPDLLLIDEPSAGLAPNLTERTFEHIERIRQTGTAILLVEQDVFAALEVVDRGYVLDMGENKFEADAETIRNSERIRDLYLGQQ